MSLFHIIGVLLAACLGAIFGSYATLFAYRLPRGESCFGRYFGKKSRCPNCESIIKTRDLIPVLNWIVTLGKCRNCGVKIPRTHLFIELSCTLLFVLCYLKFYFSEEFILYALISAGSIILITTYHTHKVFPKEILLFLMTLSVAARILQDGSIFDLIISVSFGAVLVSIFYKILHEGYNSVEKLFDSDSQLFDFMKFILIAAILMPIPLFLFYFFLISFFLLLILSGKFNKEKISLAAILIIPFLGLVI